MDFAFTPEQVELGAVVRRFLTDHAPESEVRRLMADERGWDPKLWQRMATELGLQGLAIPEQYGGGGFTLEELGIVFEEAGRALLPAPLLSSVALAATALQASGDESACADYLPGIAAGTTVATLVLTENSGRWTEDAVSAHAEKRDDQWRITGSKDNVLDGAAADLLIVVARSDAGVGLFAVDPTADGVETTPLPTFDQTRKQARVELTSAPARLIGEDGAGWPAVEQALRVGAVMLAAEQVGGMSAVLDMAVEYAKIRKQFNRPIGSFQAVKHKAADMLLRVEAARSALMYALWAASSGSDDFPLAASLVQSYCSEAYSFCAGEALQIHGGIGFTWEHRAHLYLRRAKSSQSLLGSSDEHRDVLARLAGISAVA